MVRREIKSSVESRPICQAEKRNPRSHGIPESSRRGTTMIRGPLRSPNCQTNSMMLLRLAQVWASSGRWLGEGLGEQEKGSKTNKSAINECAEWPAATGVFYSYIVWAGQP